MKAGHIFKIPPSILIIAIIIGNVMPLIGVLLYGWELFDIFYLYWTENVLIGVITAIRMAMSAASWGIATLIGTLFSIAFFCVHYGLFTFGHGTILFSLFYDGLVDVNEDPEYLLGFAFENRQEGFFIGLVGLTIAVAIDGVRKIIEDRREARLPQAIMFSPYGRIILLHATILLGGLMAASLGAPIWALIFLIALKISYDGITILNKNKNKITATNPEEAMLES